MQTFNIDMLAKSLTESFDDDFVNKTCKGFEKKPDPIGVLNQDKMAIKFVYDNNIGAILANGKIILPANNDRWTCVSTFASTMQAVYGKQFIPNKEYTL
jgi:hypothetical protein